MNVIVANPTKEIKIGRLGENLYTRVAFEISEYLQEYTNATFRLLNRRPKDSIAYPVNNIETDNQYLYWNVSSSDLTQNGTGACEFIIFDGDVIVKSIIYVTIVDISLDGSGDVPDPWQSWLTQFEEYAEEAANSARSAAESAKEVAEYNFRVSVIGTTISFTHSN